MLRQIDHRTAAVLAIEALDVTGRTMRQLVEELLNATPKYLADGTFDLLLPTLGQLERGPVVHLEDGKGNRFRLVGDNWPGDMAATIAPKA